MAMSFSTCAQKVTVTACCGCTVSFEFAPEEVKPGKAGEPPVPDDEPYDW